MVALVSTVKSAKIDLLIGEKLVCVASKTMAVKLGLSAPFFF